MSYVRVSVPKLDSAKPQMVKYDKFVAVDDDGNEAEFSQAITKWTLLNHYGSVRTLVVEMVVFAIDASDAHMESQA